MHSKVCAVGAAQQAATDDTIAWPLGVDRLRPWENQRMLSSWIKVLRVKVRFYVPLDKNRSFRWFIQSQFLGLVLKKLNLTQQKETTQEHSGKKLEANLNLKKTIIRLLRIADMCVVCVSLCTTVVHIKFRQSSLLSCRQSSLLGCCLLEGRGLVLKVIYNGFS